jgi:hypothetical protein
MNPSIVPVTSAFRPVARPPSQPLFLSPNSHALEQRAASVAQQNLERKNVEKSPSPSRNVSATAPVSATINRVAARVVLPQSPSLREMIARASAAYGQLCKFLDGDLNLYPNYESGKVYIISKQEFAPFAQRLIDFEDLFQHLREDEKSRSFIENLEEQFAEKLSTTLRKNGINSLQAHVGVLLDSEMDGGKREVLFDEMGDRINRFENLDSFEDLNLLEEMLGRDKTPKEQEALKIIRKMVNFPE